MELTIPEFSFAVLAFCGLAVFVFSCVSRWLHARAEANALRDRVVCRICLHAFMHPAHLAKGQPVECPNCGTLNEKVR